MRERRHEIGVLRSVGFRKGSIGSMMLGENMFVVLLGIGAALFATVICAWIMLGVFPPLVDNIVLIALLLVSVAVSTLVPLRGRALGSAADNLRDIE